MYQFLRSRRRAGKREVAAWLNVSDDTALRELNALIRLRLVERTGRGRAVLYRVLTDRN